MDIGLLLFPALTSALLLVVFRRAGLSFGWLVAALLPLLGAALPIVLLSLARQGTLDLSHPIYSSVPLVVALMGILPIALLAFVPWPRLADKADRPE